MAVMAVHVPKVRAERGVTGEVSPMVRAGIPAGALLPERVDVPEGPE